MTTELERITLELGIAYDNWKREEAQKNKLKTNFFEAATRAARSNTPATQIAYPEASSFDEAKEKALRSNPGWRIVHCSVQDGQYAIILEEDQNLTPFSFVNPIDGMVYQRSAVSGAIILDDEAIRESDPELWSRISRQRVVEEVIPFDEMDGEQLEAIAPYLYQEPPTVKLLAPRKAQEDE